MTRNIMNIQRRIKPSLKPKSSVKEERKKLADIMVGLDTFHLKRVWQDIKNSRNRRRAKIESDYLTLSR